MPIEMKDLQIKSEMQQMFRRQLFLYEQSQERIFEEAKKIAHIFYRHQKARSEAVRAESAKQEWSDLSVQVRRWRKQILITWRVRYWFKSHKDGRRRFSSTHLTKKKNVHHYKVALSKVASTEEYEEVMEMEEKFTALRMYSRQLHQMEKDIQDAADMLGIALPETERTAQDTETAWAIQERIGNLLNLLKVRLWPNLSDADEQAGFVPMIAPGSGAGNGVDPRKMMDAITEMNQAYAKIFEAFNTVDG